MLIIVYDRTSCQRIGRYAFDAANLFRVALLELEGLAGIVDGRGRVEMPNRPSHPHYLNRPCHREDRGVCCLPGNRLDRPRSPQSQGFHLRRWSTRQPELAAGFDGERVSTYSFAMAFYSRL
jgi:hypothetical protein